jgi:phage shock protein PspC (stress-responsive transcriptional regulator)
MNGRLLRSRHERMIGGVAGGIGQQLGVDPTWVRIAWVILAIATNGAAILVYLLLLWVIPEEEADAAAPAGSAGDAPADPLRPAVRRPVNLSLEPGSGALIVGGILVVVGAWALASQYLPAIPWSRVWPVGLVVAGLVIVIASFSRRR